MTTAKTQAQLQRLSNLAAIRSAIERTLSTQVSQDAGLAAVAQACGKLARARALRDCHTVRDELLTIACEWELGRDRLDVQSDVCLAAIVRLLRG